LKLLLTSSGISNRTIENALVDLLGKPVAESKALLVPTGIYPFRGGPYYAWSPIGGPSAPRMCHLGWKAVGLLELTALTSIVRENWVSAVEETDAILVWGGDPMFLAYWMAESGLTDLLPSLSNNLVYVGVSAGSIATASTFAEAYTALPGAAGRPLTSEEIVLPDGDIKRTLVTARGMGLTEFAIIPHFENKNHPDASLANAEQWAAKLPVPVYAIDDQTAIKVDNGVVDIVSEGQWKLFTPIPKAGNFGDMAL
jgi:dipeptidase E